MNDPEDYLNPPEAAKSEPQKNNLDMYAFIAELNRAKSNVEPIGWTEIPEGLMEVLR